MKLKLEIDGKEKSFIMQRPKLKIIKEFTKIQKLMTEDPLSSLEELERFIILVFNHEFTVDELENGLYSDDLFPVMEEITQEILGKQAVLNQTETVKN